MKVITVELVNYICHLFALFPVHLYYNMVPILKPQRSNSKSPETNFSGIP